MQGYGAACYFADRNWWNMKGMNMSACSHARPQVAITEYTCTAPPPMIYRSHAHYENGKNGNFCENDYQKRTCQPTCWTDTKSTHRVISMDIIILYFMWWTNKLYLRKNDNCVVLSMSVCVCVLCGNSLADRSARLTRSHWTQSSYTLLFMYFYGMANTKWTDPTPTPTLP